MKDFAIYYIHGFGSSIHSETYQKLKKIYPDTVSLSYEYETPGSSLHRLVNVINSDKKYPIIVGSSLGGWYAEQLTYRVVGDFILYNPSIEPEVSLMKYGATQDVLFKYKTISMSNPFNPVSRTIVLSTDDEILESKKTINKYESHARLIYTDGGHRMTDKNMTLIADAIQLQMNRL